jgi:predicted Zn-dependent peptidase
MTLVGDINFQETESLIEKYFGGLKPKQIPEAKILPLPQKNVRYELKIDGSPIQLFAWPKPVFPAPDHLHLAVAAKILAGGKDSRLFRKLVIEKNLAASVDAFSSYPGERYTNLFMILAIPAPGKSYDEIETTIKSELRNIAENGVSHDELKKTINNIEAEFIYGLQNNDQLADEISYYELITGDYKNIYNYIKELKETSSEDIKGAVQKYLSESSMHSARLIQKEGLK